MALIGVRLVDCTQMVFNRLIDESIGIDSRNMRKQIIERLKHMICFECGGIKLPWPSLEDDERCICKGVEDGKEDI
jgi:hypothetical protein